MVEERVPKQRNFYGEQDAKIKTMKTANQEMDVVRAIASGTAGLELLVLFGSRGRGDDQGGSDWDFAYLGTQSLEIGRLHAELTTRLGTDRIDLVDLARAGGLLRFRAARDGVPIYESTDGVFQAFWLKAVQFWCDARHVLDASYETVLANLDQ